MELVYLKTAKYLKNYDISLEFNTGETGVVNLEGILHKYQIAKPLLDKEKFADFYLDGWPTLAWRNGFDIAPESLYSMIKEKQ